MNAVKRGVHYWSWVFLESLGIGVIVVVCVLAVRIILGRETRSFSNVLQPGVWCGIVAESMVLCAVYLTWFRVQLPVLISFNCRRREIFRGLEGARILFCAVYGGLAACLMQGTGIIPGGMEHFWKIWILAGIGFGICTSLGELNGWLFYLFGKKMMLLVAVQFGFLGGIAGAGMGESMDNGVLRLYEGSLKLPGWGMAAAVGSLILYGLAAFASSRLLKNAEVRM